MQNFFSSSGLWPIIITIASSSKAVQGESSQVNQLINSDSAPLDLLPPVNLTDLYRSSNHSLVLNTTAATNDNEPTCDGARYGLNVNAADCLSGLDKFARTTKRLTFAERGDPSISQPTYPLPWRWMGSTFAQSKLILVSCVRLTFVSGLASCYFQPVLKPGARVGTTTMYKIRDAASELTTKCASRQGQGGIVNSLGVCSIWTTLPNPAVNIS